MNSEDRSISCSDEVKRELEIPHLQARYEKAFEQIRAATNELKDRCSFVSRPEEPKNEKKEVQCDTTTRLGTWLMDQIQLLNLLLADIQDQNRRLEI